MRSLYCMKGEGRREKGEGRREKGFVFIYNL